MSKEIKYPKRLIEVDLPIKRISVHARREKSIRHGHISTLHIWWARRPLAACRAVLCASLWPDPADELCPENFKKEAKKLITDFAKKHLDLVSSESYKRYNKIKQNDKFLEDDVEFRNALLDFIADYANWDNSTNEFFIDISRKLTETAHISLGGEPGTYPLVVDPFAGGGAIPLESLRIGSDTFASDLNPVAVLLNKVMIEYVPKFGQKLATEFKKWGMWIKEQAEKDLEKFYPKDKDGSIPVAYIWARTITCEGPGCGFKVPLIRSLLLAKKGVNSVALKLIPNKNKKKIEFEIIEKVKTKDIAEGTTKRNAAVCPNCGYITSVGSVREQLTLQQGGANQATLVCVVIKKANQNSKEYRIANELDIEVVNKANVELRKKERLHQGKLSIVPNEVFPLMSGVFNAPIYGHNTWGSLFTNRQALSLITISELIKSLNFENSDYDKPFIIALKTCLAMALDRQTDYSSSICTWVSSGEFIGHTFAQNQSLPIKTDFAEVSPFRDTSGNWEGAIDWIFRVLEHNISSKIAEGVIELSSATNHILPDHTANCIFTDPPYYNAVPYSDLSDFFYVWLKRTIGNIHPSILAKSLAPKNDEICEMSGWDPKRYPQKDGKWFETQMTIAMKECKRILKPEGVGVVVFAHKSTSGWEALLQAMLDAGWIFTGSWPIDTEMGARLRARDSAALASSIHLVVRPRIKSNSNIGDWSQVLKELPKRIHEWMPRLAEEGVVGADAIFACLGPALEIFSKYETVEKPNGDKVSLNEYLEHVWAVVSKEALSLVFKDVETKNFEEDARLTAMWLWTLIAGRENGIQKNGDNIESDEDEEDEGKSKKKIKGYTLDYDTARKIAQGLGAHLEELQTIIEVKGDKARLLPVSERMTYLFGKGGTEKQQKRKKTQQRSLFEEIGEELDTNTYGNVSFTEAGKSVLDKLHQSMLLFASGRSDALKRFLVEDGIGKDGRFWKLAQALSALYPKESEEKRWVDAVQTYKKSLGF